MYSKNIGFFMKVAVIQLNSKLDYKQNLSVIEGILSEVKNEGCTTAVLPEVFYSMSDGSSPTPYLVEEGNEHWKNIQQLVIDSGVALIGGSVAFKTDGKIVNRAMNFDSHGNTLGYYDKKRLFQVQFGNTNLNESNIYTAGTELDRKSVV